MEALTAPPLPTTEADGAWAEHAERRDEFARAALRGLVAAHGRTDLADDQVNGIATSAYRLADAMERHRGSSLYDHAAHLLAAHGPGELLLAIEAALRDAAFESRGTPTGQILFRAAEHCRQAGEPFTETPTETSK